MSATPSLLLAASSPPAFPQRTRASHRSGACTPASLRFSEGRSQNGKDRTAAARHQTAASPVLFSACRSRATTARGSRRLVRRDQHHQQELVRARHERFALCKVQHLSEELLAMNRLVGKVGFKVDVNERGIRLMISNARSYSLAWLVSSRRIVSILASSSHPRLPNIL
jgi:hypothetical protein